MPDRYEPERYEPLPSLPELPGWIWRRMGRGVRVALAVVLLAIVAAGVALAPAIDRSKEERAQRAQRERAERRARLVRTLTLEQRPIAGRSDSVAPAGAGAGEQRAARAALMGDLEGAILADARRRVRGGALKGPIRRVACEPFPRPVDGTGADRDLSRRRGRFSCLAVTAEFKRSESSVGGLIGHQYRTRVDFATGRYAYCKITGQAGPEREQLVTIPRACGGD